MKRYIDARIAIVNLERHIARLLGNNIKCTLILPEHVPVIARIERTQLRRIVNMICFHASQVMSSGSLFISTDNAVIGDSLSKSLNLRPGSYCYVNFLEVAHDLKLEQREYLLKNAVFRCLLSKMIEDKAGRMRMLEAIPQSLSFKIFLPH